MTLMWGESRRGALPWRCRGTSEKGRFVGLVSKLQLLRWVFYLLIRGSE